MRFQSRYLAVLATAALGATSPHALAAQSAYEGFNPSFPIYANSGTGFNGPWMQGGFNAFSSGYIPTEGSLCFTNLMTNGDNLSAGPFSSINGAIRSLAQPLGANGTTAYLSFLVRPRGQLNNGVFNGFFGLTLNGSLGNELFIGKPGGQALEQYVVEARGGAGQIPSGTRIVVGETALLVVKAEFLEGDDVFTLYTNPILDGLEPASTVVKADLNLGVVSGLGIYSTGSFIVDEIRLGTTYADVVPTQSQARCRK